MLSSLQNISDKGTIDETPVPTVGPVHTSRRRPSLPCMLPALTVLRNCNFIAPHPPALASMSMEKVTLS
jgi:hypothetical protein